MQTYYYELKITPSSKYDFFCELLSDLGVEAIEELDGSIFVRSEEDLEDIKNGVEEFASKLSLVLGESISVKTKIEHLKNENWIEKYQQSVQPVIVDSFYIRPSWIEKNTDKINIIIDPALAFGSGHHPSTFGCLKMIDKYVNSGDTFLDVGCGSGILSIAAAKKGAIVDICDTDELALASSKENFLLNDASCLDSWVGSVPQAKKEYGIITANIIADVLLFLAPDLIKVLKSGGVLILSGILDKYINRIESRFDSLSKIDSYFDSEWHTIVYKK